MTTHAIPAAPLARALRIAALAALVGALALWVGTGANLGWTKTSRIVTRHDEITGIDYPVHEKAFVAGIEVPVAGLLAAGTLAAAGLFAARRHAASA